MLGDSMKNKLLRIIEHVFIIVIAGVGFFYSYGKLVDIHTSFCCDEISNCPLYLCSSNSQELTKYSIYASIVVFCVIIIILFIINLIRVIFKGEK